MAWAPLRPTTRRALAIVMRLTRGVTRCAPETPSAREGSQATLCARETYHGLVDEVTVTMDATNQRVSEIVRTLDRPTPAYPGVRAGHTIERDMFGP